MTQQEGKLLEFRTRNKKQGQAAEYWQDSETEEILFGGAKGGGKSFLGCALIFGDALTYPGTHYFIARQELNDLHKFTVSSIHEVFSFWGIKLEDYGHYNGQDHAFYLKNGSKVFLISCKETPGDPLYERFGSMQMTRGWIEEASEIVQAAKANLWLSIGRWKNDTYKLKKKLLLTCNPKKGWLKWDYIDPYFSQTLVSEKKVVLSFPTDNVYLSADYLKTLSGEKDKTRRQRLWAGNWDYDEDSKNLFSFSALTDMFTNTITKQGGKYLIVDVAGDGEDKTVFGFWDGLELYRIEQFEKLNTEAIIAKIREYAASEQIPYSQIAVDAIGIGEGVASNSQLAGVIGYKSSYAAIKTDASPVLLPNVHYLKEAKLTTDYKNLRSQCIFVLSELVNNHKIAAIIEDSDKKAKIIDELFMYQSVGDADSKREATSKETLKEALGRSPDCFIAGTKVLTPKGEKNIEDIRVGDLIITPFRISKVAHTVKKMTNTLYTLDGTLTGTGNHEIYTDKGFSRLDTFLMRDYNYYRYNRYNALVWKALSLLSTKAKNIGFRGLVNTFTTNPIKMESDRNESPCTVKSGWMQQGKKYLKDMTFITLTTIHSIMCQKIYHVFNGVNMLHFISRNLGEKIEKGISKTSVLFLNLQFCGIGRKWEESGIENRENEIGFIGKKSGLHARIADNHFSPFGGDFVQTFVFKSFITKLVDSMRTEIAYYAEKLLVSGRMNLQRPAQKVVRQDCDGTPVYSLTLEEDNVYFANGILVANCSDIFLMRMYFHIRNRMLPDENGATLERLDDRVEAQFMRNEARQYLNETR